MRNGSVRVNLSIPGQVDALLCELAERTGQSKASFVTEALTWYLPRLSMLRERLREPGRDALQEDKREEVSEAYLQAHRLAGAPPALSRAERRRQERAVRKMQKRMGGRDLTAS